MVVVVMEDANMLVLFVSSKTRGRVIEYNLYTDNSETCAVGESIRSMVAQGYGTNTTGARSCLMSTRVACRVITTQVQSYCAPHSPSETDRQS